jgi:hypothetical protein
MWVTSPEIIHAYKCGYKEIYLITAIASRTVGNPFKEFIEDHYRERTEYKKRKG